MCVRSHCHGGCHCHCNHYCYSCGCVYHGWHYCPPRPIWVYNGSHFPAQTVTTTTITCTTNTSYNAAVNKLSQRTN